MTSLHPKGPSAALRFDQTPSEPLFEPDTLTQGSIRWVKGLGLRVYRV